MPDSPEVKVKLTAEDQGVAAAIKELGNQLTTLKKKQDEAASSGNLLSRAFSGIAAAAATIRLAEFGKEAFDSAINIGKMADKTGLTTQTLSVFHKVAGDVGVTTEAVDKGLVRAAKSITQFEQGSKAAAAGFTILNLKQKDFIGLNADQKVILLTTALGKHAAGLQKTTAAQLIFNRGGAEMIVVANSIAAQGMDKATAATARLGLLLDQTTTDSFRAAKASLQELHDAGVGMATQFEAGMLPAISDVGEALVDSLTQGGVSFQDMGKYAGDVIRGIALIFIGLGQTVGTVMASIAEVSGVAWDQIKNHATRTFGAIALAGTGDLTDAYKLLNQAPKGQTGIVDEEVQRQKAIYKSLADSFKADYANMFPSADEEARRLKERLARLRPDKETADSPIKKDTSPTDAAAKAQLALAMKEMQDELAIHRAYASQTEQVDKEMYDKGEIALAEYFDRRKTAVNVDAEEEIEILKKGVVLAKAEAQKAADAKVKADTPKDADKQEAARLNALAKVEELETKITEIRINASTKTHTLDTEEFKKRQESQQETLAFEKQIQSLQGKKSGVAQAEIAAEAQKRTLQVQQAGGPNLAANLAEIETWKKLKLAVAEYDDAKKKTEEDTQAFEIQKKAIEIQAKAGANSPLETEKKINDLIKQRLPLLQADAAAELAAAKATGDQGSVAAAQNTQQQVQNLTTQTNDLGKDIGGAVTGDFMHFFETVGRGTQTVGRQFANLAGSIVSSIEQIIEKMILQLIMTKLLKAAMGGVGFAGGGSVGGGGGGGGGGFAEGGLIKGSGGPKSDSIPARVSPGEYIVKSDAVTAFGVHNLEAINRGLKVPALQNLQLPQFAEGGLVGSAGPGSPSSINLGIGLDKGLILQHLESKDAGRVILNHLANNPKAAGKALSRST